MTDIELALIVIEKYPRGALCIGVWALVLCKFGELLVSLFSMYVWPQLRRKLKLNECKDGEK